jgi:hypothetical protein
VKRSVLLLAAGLAAAAVVGLAGLNSYLPGGGDNAEYISQGEALLQTGHRANLHLVGDPQDTFRPPLYPYLLAGLTRIFGRNVAAFKAVNVLFALGAVAAAWWFLIAALRTRPSPVALGGQAARGSGSAAAPDDDADVLHEAGWLTLWFALTPLTIYCAHDVLSDVFFAFLVLLSLGCAARWERPSGLRWLTGSVALLILAMLLRTAALFVSGALAAFFFLELIMRRGPAGRGRRWTMCIAFAVVTAGLVVWLASGSQIYVKSARFSGGLSEFAGRVGQQGLLYGISLEGEVVSHDTLWPYFPLPSLPSVLCHQLRMWSHWPGLLLVGLTACFGCVVLWRRGSRFVPVVWLLYMGALLLWPFFDARFHLPVLPLFLVLVWTGAREIVTCTLRRSVVAGVGATFVLLLLPVVCLIGALLALGDPQASFMTGLEWGVGGLLLGGTLIWLTARSEQGRLQHRLVALLAVAVMGLAVVRTLDQNLIREHQWGPALTDVGWPEFYVASKFIQERAASDDAVVSAKTSLVWFWTGLKGVPIPLTTDTAAGQKALERVRWAIVDDLPEEPIGQRYLRPLMESDRDHWELLERVPALDEEGKTISETLVFKRRDKPKPMPAGK